MTTILHVTFEDDREAERFAGMLADDVVIHRPDGAPYPQHLDEPQSVTEVVTGRELPDDSRRAAEMERRYDELTLTVRDLETRMAAKRELLAQAAGALRSFSLRALSVRPFLDVPYNDVQTTTPWKRTIEPEARKAHDLAMVIRKHLKEG